MKKFFFPWITTVCLLLVHSNVSANASKVPMTLKWNALDGSSHYTVTVSRQSDFQESRSFKVTRNILHVMVFPGSHYFWKIEALDAGENQLNSKKTYEFEALKGGAAFAEIAAAVAISPTEPLVSRDSSDFLQQDKEFKAEPVVFNDSPFGAELKISTEIGILDFQQSHSSFGDVDVTGLLFPAFGLALNTPKYADAIFGQFYFQQIIGDFGSDSATVTLQDSDFQWLKYGAKLHVLAYSDETWGVAPYVGFETIKTPYFYLSSPTLMTIREIDYSNALLGLRLSYTRSEMWSYYADVKYAFLLSYSGENLTDLDTSSSQFIDIDLGSIYSLPSGFFMGAALKLNQTRIDETLVDSTGSSRGSRDSLYYGTEIFAGLAF